MFLKLGICIGLVLGCVGFVLADVPAFPANCFHRNHYCSRSQVLHDQQDRRVIRLEIFVQIAKSDLANWEEVKELYFQFEDWPNYAANSDSITFIESATERGPAPDSNVRHFAHYRTKAPWPLSRIEVTDLLEYREIAKSRGEIYAIQFSQVPDFRNRKGIKYNYGQFHLLEDQQDHWLIYFYSDVVPGVDILPNVASPYILQSMEDILRGMFTK